MSDHENSGSEPDDGSGDALHQAHDKLFGTTFESPENTAALLAAEFPAALMPLTDFPDLERVYEDKDLWPFFSQRIPSLQQPAVQAYMRKRQLSEIDQATLLRRFGQRTVANPFELVVATGS